MYISQDVRLQYTTSTFVTGSRFPVTVVITSQQVSKKMVGGRISLNFYYEPTALGHRYLNDGDSVCHFDITGKMSDCNRFFSEPRRTLYKAKLWVFPHLSGVITCKSTGEIQNVNDNLSKHLFGYSAKELRALVSFVPAFYSLIDYVN